MTKEQIADWFADLQSRICAAIEQADGSGKFEAEHWQREGGGGGRSRVLQNGTVLEKAGVGFSAVHGTLPENIQNALRVSDNRFFATGVSIVMHPRSPFVPIIHKNVRYFELQDGTCWFGGGIDLTPHYINDEDARYFHSQLKAVCDRHDENYYLNFKTWADEYFFIKHRNETRGIGGIFFDRLTPTSTHSKEQLWAFVQDVGNTFAPVYSHLIQKNKDLPYTEAHKHWQGVRRSRYVEFNLVYDKGTKFGLDTNGRTESILMSMPPQAIWPYDYHPAPHSPEAETLAKLVKGIHWAE
ncbi:coproporphyrinogen oxidase [Flexibacter flexilis DSM 6793]|uniref:coproporphyrinogen oxidase n=1 Tax=Flexibacter flexilis DSM 6793 TaxID=927664 RepID=A0A1I1G4N5_9BACT|nr:oxygen-dependent coproporphyrinogen oxidase [Flexibacter flexilis]SFC06282.1 coproporphyrinogen oxidase [Flexibacter flexilis DSM 6793]